MSTQDLIPDPPGASHRPVLLDEVIAGLQAQPGDCHIDGTIGGGGHAAALLAASSPTGRLLGIDADPAAIRRVAQVLEREVKEGRLHLRQSPFSAMKRIAEESGFQSVDGILLDLGLSSFQLETDERGFSIQRAGPLDMRFDPESGLDAALIVNTWAADELADLLYQFGEEHRSRRIARAIIANRPIQTTDALATVVQDAVGGRRGKRIHPATKTFQALRIAVNDELQQLREVLPLCLALLKPGGRLAVISFHSLEDRIVKRWMLAEARDFHPDEFSPFGGAVRIPTLELITRKPIMAGETERSENPRSRSARLRIAAKPGTAD